MFGSDFYPTPAHLTDKMLEHINLDKVATILEPSAGRGDIIEHTKAKTRYGHREPQIDAIESDHELCMVLEGKGYKPIARDFLEFKTYRSYDLIIMNPPFSDGDRHLLKAIRLQKDGGQIVCLLNAETIRNPYTNGRKELAVLLERYDAQIEYIQDAFKGADRTTGVEIALVYVDIPKKQATSDILKNLVQAREVEEPAAGESRDIVEGDYINGAVKRYEIEVAAGLRLIDEYEALRTVLSKSFKDPKHSIIELTIDGDRYNDSPRNRLVNCTRMKYWQELFQSAEFGQLFTSKTRDDYRKKIDDLARYELTVSNIKQMQLELSQSMLGSLDDMIVKLFDEFAAQYWDEQSSNIHYYNGWKTNKAYIVNKKVITHLYAFDNWRGHFNAYKAYEKMTDIHKVFSYLDGALSNNHDDVIAPIQRLNDATSARGIELPYCKVDFYKKGTAHIVFKDERLLKKFNLIGSQRKGWLPPDYGKKSYTDMDEESRAVVDAFEGERSYNDTYENREFYLTNSAPVLELAAGTLTGAAD